MECGVKAVGFVGLGLMGAPMAANVARAGYPLTIYNRTAGKAARLSELGAHPADTPAEIAITPGTSSKRRRAAVSACSRPIPVVARTTSRSCN